MIHLEIIRTKMHKKRNFLFFIPALFDDKNETAAEGQRQLEWKVEQAGPFEYLSPQMSEQVHHTFDAWIFPQVAGSLTELHTKESTKNLGFEVGRNLTALRNVE